MLPSIVTKKILVRKNIIFERALPVEGELAVSVGDSVQPFDKLGVAKVSYKDFELPENFSPERSTIENSFYYYGEKIGKVGLRRILAPFDGQLDEVKNPNGQVINYVFTEEKRDYWLLSGVWGEVKNIKKGWSVLLEASCVDIPLVAAVGEDIAGELLVFPNPEEALEMQYLEKFSKDVKGKIIYVGTYLNPDVLKRAKELGVGGVIAASADRSTVTYAKKANIFLGLFTGFGHMETANETFDVIKEISSRYVFVLSSKNILRIPIPRESPFFEMEKTSKKQKNFGSAKLGSRIQVFSDPYFGWTGEITKVQNDIIHVKLDESGEEVEVNYPNFILMP